MPDIFFGHSAHARTNWQNVTHCSEAVDEWGYVRVYFLKNNVLQIFCLTGELGHAGYSVYVMLFLSCCKHS
jgi:hypothetical protein